jgi:hypothetical protein
VGMGAWGGSNWIALGVGQVRSSILLARVPGGGSGAAAERCQGGDGAREGGHQATAIGPALLAPRLTGSAPRSGPVAATQ